MDPAGETGRALATSCGRRFYPVSPLDTADGNLNNRFPDCNSDGGFSCDDGDGYEADRDEGSDDRDSESCSGGAADTNDDIDDHRHANPAADDEPSLKKTRLEEDHNTAGVTKDLLASPLFEPMDKNKPLDFVATQMSPCDKTPLEGLKRARAMKAGITNNILLHKPKAPKRSLRVEDDPENQLIKRLRQEHKMDWGAIANYLNEERQKRGEPAVFTQPAVYSRFVRNGPRIAAALGETGFDPKNYMYLRDPLKYAPACLTNTITTIASPTPPSTKKRRHEPDYDVLAKVNIRPCSDDLAVQCAELQTIAKTELLMQAVVTVERKFWVYVADELDCLSGRLYDPKAIESRYHAI